jgi:hypothetical protein
MNRWTFAKIVGACHTNAHPQTQERLAAQSIFLFLSPDSPGELTRARGPRTQSGNGGN